MKQIKYSKKQIEKILKNNELTKTNFKVSLVVLILSAVAYIFFTSMTGVFVAHNVPKGTNWFVGSMLLVFAISMVLLILDFFIPFTGIFNYRKYKKIIKNNENDKTQIYSCVFTIIGITLSLANFISSITLMIVNIA